MKIRFCSFLLPAGSAGRTSHQCIAFGDVCFHFFSRRRQNEIPAADDYAVFFVCTFQHNRIKLPVDRDPVLLRILCNVPAF